MTITIDYNDRNDTWRVTASVRDTYDLKDIPGSRASRKTAPGLALWTVPGTIGAARQLKRDLPEAEWTGAALTQRHQLATLRKGRIRAKTQRFDNLERAMERYEHASIIDSQTLRHVRAGLLPVEGDESVLLPCLQGREPHPGGAEPTSAEGSSQEAGATGGQGRGEDVPEATRTTRAPGRSRADARPAPATGRGRAPRERGQTGQPTEQPMGVRKPGGPRALSPMQTAGVAHLLGGSGILADDMGSGKSVMTSVAAALLGARTTLVLTTVSTLYVWADHLREWAGIKPFIFHGPKRAAVFTEYEAYQGPKALISTHALARKHSARASFGNVAADGADGEFNIPFDIGIIDEVHRMGLDPKAPGVRAMHRIAGNCDIRWALSGTPVNERPDDMWNLMRFVDKRVLQDRGAFRKRYCIMVDTGFKVFNDGLHPDMIEEFDFLVQPYFLRRLKREVWTDLPKALPPQYVRLPLTSAQQTLYNRLVKDGLTRLPSGEVLVAPSALDLSRVCEYVAQGIPEIDGEGKVTKLSGPSNKLEYILDIMAERGPERPIVVFAHSPKVTAMLAEGLRAKHHRVAEITGSVPAPDRQALCQAFQSGSLDAMLITSAGAEGITLTAADLIIFVQEHWRATTNQQTRDRIDRIGQTKETSTIVLSSTGTVDETKRLAVVRKINTQQLTLRDKKELASFLNGTWNAS